MKSRPRLLAIAGGVLTPLAVLLFAAVANLDALIAWQIRRTVLEGEIANEAAQRIPDSRFELIFCGTGTPRFSPHRTQSCLAVIAGGRMLLFDAGRSTARQLEIFKAPTESLEAIFITHLHSDHMSGLGEVLQHTWHFGRDRQVEVMGPPGTERMHAGFSQAFAEDEAMRRYGVELGYDNKNSAMGRARDVRIDSNGAVTVYDDAGIVVKAFRVVHPKWHYAYGFRVDFGGKSVVISGDTAYAPAIIHHARDVDVLVHEVMNVEMMRIASEVMESRAGGGVAAMSDNRMRYIVSRHTPTDQVARVARKSAAKTLVLTHFTPPIPADWIAEYAFTRGMDELYDGEIVVARDGMRMRLID